MNYRIFILSIMLQFVVLSSGCGTDDSPVSGSPSDTVVVIDTIRHVDSIWYPDTIIVRDTIHSIDTIKKMIRIVDTVRIIDTVEFCVSDTGEPDPGDNGTVKDIDGNEYHTIKIGTRTWMVENLKTTHFNDGTRIPLFTDNSTWSNSHSEGYCWYANDMATYKPAYGALYNGYAVQTGKLAPKGWHVATDADWTILSARYGGDTESAGALKASGAAWQSPNEGATNASGFAALGGGYRKVTGGFSGTIAQFGNWWSSTSSATNEAWYRSISYQNTRVYRGGYDINNGLSVRCVKN